MRVRIVGLDHDTQWRDQTGHFKVFLEDLVRDEQPDLIAEEAYTLPTTVGGRIALKFHIPWIDVDMDQSQRDIAKYESPSPYPVWNSDGKFGTGMAYEEAMQAPREEYWIHQINEQRCNEVLFICGAIHLDPVARKLREKGVIVIEYKLWQFDWYTTLVSKLTIATDRKGIIRSETFDV